MCREQGVRLSLAEIKKRVDCGHEVLLDNRCDDARAAVAACPSTSSHTRPQLRENDGAFVAVERADSNGWCDICRGGQEKTVYAPTVGDVDVILKRLDDVTFACPVWREGVRDCGGRAGAGDGSWRGGGGGGPRRPGV